MAKIETVFVASNGSTVEFRTHGLDRNCFNIEKSYWPLDEFEDLVKFVRSHIAEQAATGESKLSELQEDDNNE